MHPKDVRSATRSASPDRAFVMVMMMVSVLFVVMLVLFVVMLMFFMMMLMFLSLIHI